MFIRSIVFFKQLHFMFTKSYQILCGSNDAPERVVTCLNIISRNTPKVQRC